MLGGADRRTLYLVTGNLEGDEATLLAQRPGRIESVRVEVPGAGWP
jgi:sugar lactone lactonase YvrE